MKQRSSATKFAVVTGASSGIGFELARQFAQHNFELLIAAEDDGIAEAGRRLEEFGMPVETLQVDLAQFSGVEKLFARIKSAGRPVDAIAINAGVGVGGDFTRQTDLEAELNLISLNVVSPVHLAKRILPDMVRRGEGRILFTASVVSTMPAPFLAVYGASKAFVLSFSEAIRNELKDTGVTVTALMPGATETNFFHRAGMDDTKVGVGKKDDPAEVAKQGFEALMSGEEKVVAGSMMNKVQTVAGNVIPDSVKAELHRKQAEPGSADR
ncbi:MAG: SDR family NAD(P)-dependent oxidoreductase [Bryobacteraceae bacterium]